MATINTVLYSSCVVPVFQRVNKLSIYLSPKQLLLLSLRCLISLKKHPMERSCTDFQLQILTKRLPCKRKLLTMPVILSFPLTFAIRPLDGAVCGRYKRSFRFCFDAILKVQSGYAPTEASPLGTVQDFSISDIPRDKSNHREIFTISLVHYLSKET